MLSDDCFMVAAVAKFYLLQLSWTTLAVAVSLVVVESANAQHATEDEAAAPAEESADPVEQRALDMFNEGERLYQAGRVEEALSLLLAARRLHPEPVLLYNIARVYETLGRLEEARAHYHEYLEAEPAAADRGAIETRIAAIDAQLEERDRLSREQRSGVHPGAWVVTAVGVAALGAAVTLGILADQARSDAVDAPSHQEGVEAFQRGESMATAANVLYAVGGTIALVGATWLIVSLLSDDDEAETPEPGDVGFVVGPGGLALSVGLR
jgi:tetratricopeptide (TPR) repeat protein